LLRTGSAQGDNRCADSVLAGTFLKEVSLPIHKKHFTFKEIVINMDSVFGHNQKTVKEALQKPKSKRNFSTFTRRSCLKTPVMTPKQLEFLNNFEINHL